jgi:DNA-binding NarL/FixJ family response regulator
MAKPKILLADDDRDFLQALQTLLTSEFEVVASVGDGQALMEAAAACAPDVIVTDISMPLLSGFRAARQLRSDWPNTPIIFLTVREDAAFVTEAKKLGASGYVVKRSTGSDLVPAIHSALRGGSFISAGLDEPHTSLRS